MLLFDIPPTEGSLNIAKTSFFVLLTLAGACFILNNDTGRLLRAFKCCINMQWGYVLTNRDNA